MTSCCILHLTDFHIKSPDDTDELLRDGKYREYLGDLVVAISQVNLKIDCVIATGDFVNWDGHDHFPHAAKVINFVLDKTNVSPKSAALCIGNHDIQDASHRGGKLSESRRGFADLANKYANSSPISQSKDGRAILCKLNDGIWALMIDCLLGCSSSAEPCPSEVLSAKETDQIMNLVHEVPLGDTLLIGTHYAVETSPGSLAAYEDGQDDWFKKHTWIGATPLRERISRHRKVPRKTVWLSGDIHRDHVSELRNTLFVCAGRIGTRTGGKDSQIRRSAIVVEVTEYSIRIHTFRYTIDSHLTQAEYGDWKHESREYCIASSANDPKEIQFAGIGVRTELAESRVAQETKTRAKTQCELISVAGNDAMLRDIQAKRLYIWGRFHTASDVVLLSWISIGPLMNVPQRLGATIRDMAIWLSNRNPKVTTNPETLVVLGIDCWGAILASQLSVVTGIRNYCIAGRGRGVLHTSYEGITAEVLEAVSHAETIIVVTDVVATGNTVKWIYDEITGNIPCQVEPKTWLALSVISDPDQPFVADCSFLSAHGTACKIARPFLPSARVPSPEFVPVDLAIPQ